MNSQYDNEFSIYIHKLLIRVIQQDHLWSKRIQQYVKYCIVPCSMVLPESTEYYLAVPTMLFGRHVVPYIILVAFILLRFHCACYYGCSWFDLSLSFYLSNSMLTVLISEALKNILRRPRPSKSSISKRVLPIRDDVTNPAFPSGDSAQVAFTPSFQSLGRRVRCVPLSLLR